MNHGLTAVKHESIWVVGQLEAIKGDPALVWRRKLGPRYGEVVPMRADAAGTAASHRGAGE